MFLTQIKHAQIKINLLSFWTVHCSCVTHPFIEAFQFCLLHLVHFPQPLIFPFQLVIFVTHFYMKDKSMHLHFCIRVHAECITVQVPRLAGTHTVIRFVWVSAKFGTCTVVSVNVEDKMHTFKGDSFNKCPIYNHVSVKFGTSWGPNGLQCTFKLHIYFLSVKILKLLLKYLVLPVLKNNANDLVFQSTYVCLRLLLTQWQLLTG